jgi:hypothetical protein
VTIEELAVIVPLIIGITVPIMILGLSRYFSSSDRLKNSTVMATYSINDIQKELSELQDDMREVWKRLESVSSSIQLICYRLDKLENGTRK